MPTRTGDERAFNRLFDAHYEAISRYCHRRLPASVANDATAEVFTVAWRKIGDAPPADQALPWLYGVARNEVRTHQRSIRRFTRLTVKISGLAHHPDPGPETVVVRNEDQAALLDALSSLRPSDQEILRLRAYEGLTAADIAVVLGCSVEAAKKRSTRAMQRLRKAAALPEPSDAVSGSRAIPEGGDG